LVVKKGSKIFSRIPGGTPGPVSEKTILTCFSSRTARMVNVPSCPMASRAFFTMLSKTSHISVLRHEGSPGGTSTRSLMFEAWARFL